MLQDGSLKIFFDSILEFGTLYGYTYQFAKPTRYLGIDIDPKWYPDPNPDGLIEVVKADIFKWEPPSEHFDLVICDAHVEPLDNPAGYAIHYRQALLAETIDCDFILVHDVHIDQVFEASVKVLGKPWKIRYNAAVWRK